MSSSGRRWLTVLLSIGLIVGLIWMVGNVDQIKEKATALSDQASIAFNDAVSGANDAELSNAPATVGGE
jgi:hypothetical protein